MGFDGESGEPQSMLSRRPPSDAVLYSSSDEKRIGRLVMGVHGVMGDEIECFGFFSTLMPFSSWNDGISSFFRPLLVLGVVMISPEFAAFELFLLVSSSVWLIALSTSPEAFRSALIQLFLTFDVTDDRLRRLLSHVCGDEK